MQERRVEKGKRRSAGGRRNMMTSGLGDKLKAKGRRWRPDDGEPAMMNGTRKSGWRHRADKRKATNGEGGNLIAATEAWRQEWQECTPRLSEGDRWVARM